MVITAGLEVILVDLFSKFGPLVIASGTFFPFRLSEKHLQERLGEMC
jgi:hypothetical protein